MCNVIALLECDIVLQGYIVSDTSDQIYLVCIFFEGHLSEHECIFYSHIPNNFLKWFLMNELILNRVTLDTTSSSWMHVVQILNFVFLRHVLDLVDAQG